MGAIAGFADTPGKWSAVVRTSWRTSDIWLRRKFVIKRGDVQQPFLRAHHDEDAEIYLNGHLIKRLPGFVNQYEEFSPDNQILEALVDGENVLAVHCHQTTAGQNIDVGILDRRIH